MSDQRENLPLPLRRWLAEQPRERRDELERTWMLADLAREEMLAGEEVEVAWQDVAAALDAPRRTAAHRHSTRRAENRRPARRPRRRAVRRVAAAAVVLLLVGIGVFWYGGRPVEVAAPPGATATAQLPDGSEVMLGSASALTYRRGLFGWDRAVRLDGEAFFDVAAGEDVFTVTTFNARVEVLGTRFNVRSRAGDATPATTVTLAEGRVQLAARGAPRRAVTLAPGQQSRVVGRNGTPTAPQPVDLETVLAWRTGGLAFSNAPLRAILREVERRFGVEIRVEAPALLGDSLSLFLPDAQSAGAVLRDLCAYRNCNVRRTPGGFVLEETEER